MLLVVWRKIDIKKCRIKTATALFRMHLMCKCSPPYSKSEIALNVQAQLCTAFMVIAKQDISILLMLPTLLFGMNFPSRNTKTGHIKLKQSARLQLVCWPHAYRRVSNTIHRCNWSVLCGEEELPPPFNCIGPKHSTEAVSVPMIHLLFALEVEKQASQWMNVQGWPGSESRVKLTF